MTKDPFAGEQILTVTQWFSVLLYNTQLWVPLGCYIVLTMSGGQALNLKFYKITKIRNGTL